MIEKINKLEVVKRFVEQKEQKALEKCLKKLVEKSESIGAGDNAEVLGIKDKHFGDVCLKMIKKIPKIKCNDIEAEFEFQNEVNDLGVRTPVTLAYVKNPATNDLFILMERISGPSLEDIISRGNEIPKNYSHESFWSKLFDYLNIMHESGIHHRDLHKGNIMIDKNGGPVIIDFGTAGRAWGSEDDPYKDEALIYNELTKRYDHIKGYFLNDKKKALWSKDKMAELLPNY